MHRYNNKKVLWGTKRMQLAECLKTLGLQDDIKLLETNGFRWLIEYKQNPAFPDFGKSMIKLERLLQEKTRKPIDLRLEDEADKNKRVQRNVLNEPK